MVSTPAQLEVKLNKFETNLEAWDNIINGDEETDVSTDNGNVPSWAKFLEIYKSAQALAFRYTFSTTTAASDPGSGILKLNNATLSSVTACYIDNLDANGQDIADVLSVLCGSNSAIKATLIIRQFDDITKWAAYRVTADSDSSGYRTFTLTHIKSGALFDDGASLFVSINRTGDQGASGAGSGDMNAATYDPNTVGGDAFDMDNMVEGANTKIMTATERSNLGTAYGWGDHGAAGYIDSAALAAAIGVSIQAYDAQLSSLLVQNSKSANYTLVATDSGKHIFHPAADTTARVWTIPSNASVPFAIGTCITFINQHNAGVITIAITSDTMRLAGPGTTGSRTLADDGIATAVKITATQWIISGVGLS